MCRLVHERRLFASTHRLVRFLIIVNRYNCLCTRSNRNIESSFIDSPIYLPRVPNDRASKLSQRAVEFSSRRNNRDNRKLKVTITFERYVTLTALTASVAVVSKRSPERNVIDHRTEKPVTAPSSIRSGLAVWNFTVTARQCFSDCGYVKSSRLLSFLVSSSGTIRKKKWCVPALSQSCSFSIYCST